MNVILFRNYVSLDVSFVRCIACKNKKGMKNMKIVFVLVITESTSLNFSDFPMIQLFVKPELLF